MREANLKNIISQLASKVLEGDKECRDIYSMACQSFMLEISDSNAPIIIQSIYPIIKSGLVHKQEDVVEEFVDLFTELLKKFTKVLINNQGLIDQAEMLKNLFERL